MMPTHTLTPAQQRIVDAIRSFWRLRGIPPTFRDLAQEAGLRSTNSVHFHVRRLEDMGVIEREPGVARSIRLIEEEAV